MMTDPLIEIMRKIDLQKKLKLKYLEMLLRFSRKEDSNGWVKKKDSSDVSEDVMKDDFNNLVDNLKNDFDDTSPKFSH